MKIYMDVCCLYRPFDDQSQDKVRFEAEAVISILKRCGIGKEWRLVGSDIVSFEISKGQDSVKRQKVLFLYDCATERVKYSVDMKSRAAELRKYNVKLFDSLHLAAAEYADVDVFLTTDVWLVREAARLHLKMRVMNPLAYYMEVLDNEQSGG